MFHRNVSENANIVGLYLQTLIIMHCTHRAKVKIPAPFRHKKIGMVAGGECAHPIHQHVKSGLSSMIRHRCFAACISGQKIVRSSKF